VKLTSLHDVFVEQIADLLSAEHQLVDALPDLAEAASTPALREAFEAHLEETRVHVTRLEQVLDIAGLSTPDEECEAMQGLIREGAEIAAASGDSLARDVALIAAAQRVEHYEIAAYGTARELAGQLDLSEVASILDETLAEENAADQTLTRVATGGLFTGGVNEKAAH
jgi:ferritin-like metal-binding protein YciE